MKIMATMVVFVFSVMGCVPTPSTSPDDVVALQPDGVFVLCEGLWQQNNAVVSYIAPSQQIRSVFSAGDTGTDLVRHDTSLLVIVSTSQKLLAVDPTSGTVERTITLPQRQPYHAALANGKIWVTNLGDDSITELSADLTITVPRVTVGPAPEGICALGRDVYVGLSGMGDLRKDEPGAGTIVVLRQSDLSAIDTIADVPNVADVIADAPRERVWASYRSFASTPDVLGGVVKIDGKTREVGLRLAFDAPTDLVCDPRNGDLYVLHRNGIDRIDGVTMSVSSVIQHTSGNGNDVWYSLGWDERSGHLMIGNARSYVTDGEVIEITTDGTIVRRSPVGVNPTAFAY